MSSISLIGASGLIGQELIRQFSITHQYDSKNIDTFSDTSHELIFCAAPSGNRINVNQNTDNDKKNINSIINVVKRSSFNNIILFSTIDTLVKKSNYANNRLYLEQSLLETGKCKVLRLSSLISPFIKKNLLYDLKNKSFLNHINRFDSCQWFDLIDIKEQIYLLLNSNKIDLNLVSEPILNEEIIQKFYPDILEIVGGEKSKSFSYNVQPYIKTKKEIFNSMEKYFANKC